SFLKAVANSRRPSAPLRNSPILLLLEEVQHNLSQVSTPIGGRRIAEKIGCSGETLRNWVRQAERDAGKRPGLTTTERARIKELERENRELRRANEILRKAAAFFAQAELDRKQR